MPVLPPDRLGHNSTANNRLTIDAGDQVLTAIPLCFTNIKQALESGDTGTSLARETG
jgi:hypothetical protein